MWVTNSSSSCSHKSSVLLLCPRVAAYLHTWLSFIFLWWCFKYIIPLLQCLGLLVLCTGLPGHPVVSDALAIHRICLLSTFSNFNTLCLHIFLSWLILFCTWSIILIWENCQQPLLHISLLRCSVLYSLNFGMSVGLAVCS